eukprot:TRINITY_DN75118_c0_g1_i1.p1 TRINITY_DN75118_c0_g1~~TRINITY_DN75118_c0_g1_i1.p1  ORF type:complete len:296 (-),score=46.67 TRINITY_DN75118_c0_g1_i1:22-840(-)
MARSPPAFWRNVRVLTLDATGTLMYHREGVAETYCRCAARVGVEPPPLDAMKASFKEAFKASLERWPCFGHADGLSSREWWRRTVEATFAGARASFCERDFARVFRSVYQHYGSLEGYTLFEDVKPFLDWASDRYCIGLLSNNVDRLADNTLPLLGLHKHVHFFVLSHEVGFEKPSPEIFARACEEASAILQTPVLAHEVLHIGDNYAVDYCGARAAGMSAALISRKGVAQYQTWLDAPDYHGKAEEEVQQVTSLAEIRGKLEADCTTSIDS